MQRWFDEAKLSDGTLTVKGPFERDPGLHVRHLRFMVEQAGKIVEDKASVSESSWSGQTPAEGLQPGAAHGFGLAVLMKPDAPPRYETFTWFEPITVT